MSEQNNTELLERVQAVLDNVLISKKQVDVIQRLVNAYDLEGLYWVLPKIEQDLDTRYLELAREVQNA